MKTGQVMKQFGIKRDTLRFYTEQGLLQPQLINGNYYWNEDEINNLLPFNDQVSDDPLHVSCW